MSDVDLGRTVAAQLERWGLADAPEAAAALDIAARLAEDELRPAAAAMLHAQLRGYMAALRELAPLEVPEDGVSDLQQEYAGLRVVGER